MKNPTLIDLGAKVAGAEKIFADHDTFIRPRDFGYTSITSSDLKEKLFIENGNNK